MIGNSLSRAENDVCAKNNSSRSVAVLPNRLQPLLRGVSQNKPGRRWKRHILSMHPSILLVKLFQIQMTSGLTSCNAKLSSNSCHSGFQYITVDSIAT